VSGIGHDNGCGYSPAPIRRAEKGGTAAAGRQNLEVDGRRVTLFPRNETQRELGVFFVRSDRRDGAGSNSSATVKLKLSKLEHTRPKRVVGAEKCSSLLILPAETAIIDKVEPKLRPQPQTDCCPRDIIRGFQSHPDL